MRKTLKWSLCASVLAAGVTLGTSSIVDASTASTSTPGLLSLAIHDAEGSGWVHETESATGSGHTFSAVNDIGASEGRQVIVADGAHAQVLVIGGNAYLYGDDRAIAGYFGISTTDPEKYANQWFKLTPSNPDYSTVSAAVTLKSDFGHVEALGRFKEGGIVEVSGQKVRSFTAHIPASSQNPAGNATLYVTTSAKPLPVGYVLTAKGIKSTTHWADWGHQVHLTAPSAKPLSY
jgi:hypothetical protein